MPELPSHHDTGAAGSEAPIAGGSRRRRALVIAGVVAVVVLVAVLHLTGVIGGEGH